MVWFKCAPFFNEGTSTHGEFYHPGPWEGRYSSSTFDPSHLLFSPPSPTPAVGHHSTCDYYYSTDCFKDDDDDDDDADDHDEGCKGCVSYSVNNNNNNNNMSVNARMRMDYTCHECYSNYVDLEYLDYLYWHSPYYNARGFERPDSVPRWWGTTGCSLSLPPMMTAPLFHEGEESFYGSSSSSRPVPPRRKKHQKRQRRKSEGGFRSIGYAKRIPQRVVEPLYDDELQRKSHPLNHCCDPLHSQGYYNYVTTKGEACVCQQQQHCRLSCDAQPTSGRSCWGGFGCTGRRKVSKSNTRTQSVVTSESALASSAAAAVDGCTQVPPSLGSTRGCRRHPPPPPPRFPPPPHRSSTSSYASSRSSISSSPSSSSSSPLTSPPPHLPPPPSSSWKGGVPSCLASSCSCGHQAPSRGRRSLWQWLTCGVVRGKMADWDVDLTSPTYCAACAVMDTRAEECCSSAWETAEAWLAERKKNEGNELYKAKEYREALKLYTQAIDLCPDCAAYYSNRSACNMMLGKYHDALNDAREAVRLDTTFVKGYIRVAKCNIALGDANAAMSVLRQAGDLEPTNKSIRDEMNNAQALLRCLDEVTKATDKADYRTALFHIDRALDQAVGCRSLKITKAEYLVFLQRFADAQEMVNEILQFDSGNADAIYVRGMCLYYQDNPDAAFTHFQHVLRLAPDHHKARGIYKKAKQLKQKKEEGNDAFKRGSYQEAYDLYTDALAIDPLNKNTNAKLYFNRATVGSKLNKLEEAVEDCTAAINLDEGYVKAYLRRAKCYQTLEKHEEAVRDYEKVTRLDRNQEHKRLLHEAKIQLKRSKRKDYYKILGVNKNASEDEIKKSYRKMALVHHPDRHANASDKDKREHEIKFKEIGEAYSVLTDAKKRAMYDRGQDINDPDGGFGHEADIDPNQIFQAFFGGHGGHGFGAHASFQQGGFPGGGFSGGSFPGGFHFQFG